MITSTVLSRFAMLSATFTATVGAGVASAQRLLIDDSMSDRSPLSSTSSPPSINSMTRDCSGWCVQVGDAATLEQTLTSLLGRSSGPLAQAASVAQEFSRDCVPSEAISRAVADRLEFAAATTA